jgi:hypothetical protein
MLSSTIHQLAPAPRPVPLRLACRAVLGLTGGLGAVFLLFGMVFVWIFAGDFDPVSDIQLALSKETTQGVITRVSATNTNENDVTVYRYEFSFRARDEGSYTGASYRAGSTWSAEERVTIEYVPSDPDIARIQGARRATMPVWAAVLVFIFPAIGAVFFISSTLRGAKQVRLLRHGELAGADIISQHPTGTSINDVPVMAYVYEFPASDGESYLGQSRALPTGRVGDEAKEPVLYLPWNPRKSTLVDTLPTRFPLQVDEFGHWIGGVTVWSIVWVTLIWLGIAANAAYFLWRVAGRFLP